MKTSTSLFLAAAVLFAVALFVGCSDSNSRPSGDWKTGLDEAVVDAFSQLSEADRIAALEQNVCPVANKQLGSMGKPPKVAVEGREVFLCCSGCEERLKSDPAKFFARLKSN